MGLSDLIISWKGDWNIRENITTWETIPAAPARTGPFPENLHPLIAEALRSQDIATIYSHQQTAWEAICTGKNLVICTGTASGKSLCYMLPIMQAMVSNADSRALLLFPTKALSQDQLHSCAEFINALKRSQYSSSSNSLLPEIYPAVYDGDTDPQRRPIIRKKSRIIFSNPDMLHMGVLPHHATWAGFLQNLQFIVIDEIHYYRGVFGSHVTNIIRRLKRICSFYGANPQFILTSATISNPLDFAEKLIEKEVDLIDDDGSPHGQKHFIIYNPPVINKELGLRRSAILESARLAEELIVKNIQSIIFTITRPAVEILLSNIRQRLGILDAQNETRIRGYRSGYLPSQRREIERDLRAGVVRAVVATNALELGIDIGGVDAILMVGYPGSIAATRQQAGRAGRGLQPALAVLVASSDPIDQFLTHHPEFLFSKTPEAALINPDNLLILLGHVNCAAFELPFHKNENFGACQQELLSDILNYLVSQGTLSESDGRYFWLTDRYPAQTISLRNSSTDEILLQEISETDPSKLTLVGKIDYGSSLWMTHPHAIYLHEAQTYFVQDLDLVEKKALLQKANVDYYTQPRRDTSVIILTKECEQDFSSTVRGYGEVRITSQVIGFRKIRWSTNEQLGLENLALPATELVSSGYWLTLKENFVNRLKLDGVWNSSTNDYGPGWPTIRAVVRQRDGFRCQVCGVTETGREHDVHHKIPFRSFASASQANMLTNLVTLCHPCHQKVELNVRVRTGLSGLAYVFGHLAPLFLMCDNRDIGVHFDPQSNIVEGNPILVVYENSPAGLGFSDYLFLHHHEIIESAISLIDSCECSDGCPSCVGPGGENGTGAKTEALAILRELSKDG